MGKRGNYDEWLAVMQVAELVHGPGSARGACSCAYRCKCCCNRCNRCCKQTQLGSSGASCRGAQDSGGLGKLIRGHLHLAGGRRGAGQDRDRRILLRARRVRRQPGLGAAQAAAGGRGRRQASVDAGASQEEGSSGGGGRSSDSAQGGDPAGQGRASGGASAHASAQACARRSCTGGASAQGCAAGGGGGPVCAGVWARFSSLTSASTCRCCLFQRHRIDAGQRVHRAAEQRRQEQARQAAAPQ